MALSLPQGSTGAWGPQSLRKISAFEGCFGTSRTWAHICGTLMEYSFLKMHSDLNAILQHLGQKAVFMKKSLVEQH